MENKEFNLRNFLYNNPLLEGEDKKEKEEHEEGAIADDRDHIDALDADAEADEKKLRKDRAENPRTITLDVKESVLRKAIQNEITSILREAEEVTEAVEKIDADSLDKLAEQLKLMSSTHEGEEGDKYFEASELLAKASSLLRPLMEAEDVDVDVEKDVDVDIEDEVTIDDEPEESEIEVDSELSGEDAETAGVLGLLTKAQAEAEALGDEKLMDQIGNTITYFTRAHVVKSTETRAVAETKLFTRRR